MHWGKVGTERIPEKNGEELRWIFRETKITRLTLSNATNAGDWVARDATTGGGLPLKLIQKEDGVSARIAATPFLRIKLLSTAQTNAS